MATLPPKLNNKLSNNKANMINTDRFHHIFDSIKPSSPIICFEKATHIYHIDLEKLDTYIECFFNTIHITYYGVWKNNVLHPIDTIFILPIDSNTNIIECTINSHNIIRTTTILKHKDIPKTPSTVTPLDSDTIETKTETNTNDIKPQLTNNINNSNEPITIKLNDINSNKMCNSWCAEQMGLFSHQIDGQFRCPIFNVLPNEQIIIKIKCIQSIHSEGINGFYLRLPLQFYHAQYPKYDNENTIHNN
eukprot:366149_1